MIQKIKNFFRRLPIQDHPLFIFYEEGGDTHYYDLKRDPFEGDHSKEFDESSCPKNIQEFRQRLIIETNRPLGMSLEPGHRVSFSFDPPHGPLFWETLKSWKNPSFYTMIMSPTSSQKLYKGALDFKKWRTFFLGSGVEDEALVPYHALRPSAKNQGFLGRIVYSPHTMLYGKTGLHSSVPSGTVFNITWDNGEESLVFDWMLEDSKCPIFLPTYDPSSLVVHI
jgi:hypothetical protein